MALKPCPLCGCALVERPAYAGHPVNDCLLSGIAYGRNLWDKWNRRTGLGVVIEDNRPVFNNDGAGQAVDAHWLNQMVEYYTGGSK